MQEQIKLLRNNSTSKSSGYILHYPPPNLQLILNTHRKFIFFFSFKFFIKHIKQKPCCCLGIISKHKFNATAQGQLPNPVITSRYNYLLIHKKENLLINKTVQFTLIVNYREAQQYRQIQIPKNSIISFYLTKSTHPEREKCQVIEQISKKKSNKKKA